MTKNVKSIFLVATLLVLLVSITAISASDLSDDSQASAIEESVVQDAGAVDVSDNSYVADAKTTKNIKKESKTHIVNNDTVQTVFNKEGTSPYRNAGFSASLLGDEVEDGDTLDFQGFIGGNYNLSINKPVNIISSTNDAVIELNSTSANLMGSNPGNHFIITKEGSYTNVTGITFHNTQLFVYNSNHVILDNISAVVEDRTIGGGIGQTSIRENSSDITVKNSYFYTRNNGGSSTLVLAWADNCTIYNNTIKAEGNSGNLFYLTTINLNNYDWMDQGVIPNCNNKIINNTIGTIGQETGGIQWSFVLTGTNNTIDGNQILSGGIQSQYGGAATGNGMTYITNNNVIAGGLASNINSNLTIENNTFGGNVMIYYNATIKNNTLDTLNLLQETSVVTNNSFRNLNIQGSSTNNYIADNKLSGIVNIQTKNNTFINNSVINTDEYTVKVTAQGNNISDNFLVAGTRGGIETANIIENNIVENNRPIPTEYTITEENYTAFFDENGYFINSDVENYDALTLDGTFNNKNFIFNNTIHTVTGVDCIINNGQLKINDNGQIILNNITINNDESIDTTLEIDSDKNTIGNITIKHETSKDNINVIVIKGLNNKLLKNNITVVNNKENSITKAVYITNDDITTTMTNTIINYNNINMTTKGESYAIDSSVPFNTNNITHNNIIINANDNIYAINIDKEGKNNTITYNTFDLNTTKDVKAIKITEQEKDTISYNNMTITGSNVQAIELLSSNFTSASNTASSLWYNNININSDNTTVMTLMRVSEAGQNNITITSPEAVAIHYINASGSNTYFQNTIPLTVANGTAAIIENSRNTYVGGYINTQKAITYTNVTNLNRGNIGQIISDDEYTMIFDSCENIKITNTYLISDNYHKGGDNTVNVIDGNNITITDNVPNFAYLNDETYNTLFDENNVYTSTKSLIFIAPELNDKTMIFNSYVNITCINDAVINSGVIKLTENATNSIINNTKINNTQIIIEANNTKLTNSTINQYTTTPIIIINKANNIYLQYNNITNNQNEDMQILIDNSSSIYIQYNNITGITTKNIDISVNNTNSINIQNNNITSPNQNTNPLIKIENANSGSITNNYLLTNDLYGKLAISSNNSTLTISNNTPLYEIIITNDNYDTYFDSQSNYIGDVNAEALVIGSDIYNKNFTFSSKTLLTNPNKYTLYNTTIKNTDNSSTTTITNIIINNTNYDASAIISNGRLDINYSTITQICNNTEVIVLENYTSTGDMENNNITCIGDNNIVIKTNNYRRYFRYNNVNVTGNNTITLYITNTSSTRNINNNNFTINTNSSTTHFIFENSRVLFTDNNITVHAYQNDIPIIKVINNTNGRVSSNYIVSNDLAGDNAVTVIGAGTSSDNMPYTTTITLTNTTSLVETPITITATVLLNNIEPMPMGTVTFTDENGATLDVISITDGTATIELTYPEEGTHEITATFNVTYAGLEIWNSTNSITINVIDNATKLVVEPITTTVGDVINITASIIQNHQTLTDINKGKVIFKVNGKTLKDENGKVIYAKVVNGVATIENYLVPDDWAKNGSTMEAIYSGSTQCEKLTSEKTNITITSPEPTITITPITSDVQTGSTVTLKAKVASGDKAITTGKIVFKINGKTVKDENGKVIYAKVDSNGEVSVDYTIPESFKVGTYTIEAVFTASGYEKLTSNTTMTVVKS